MRLIHKKYVTMEVEFCNEVERAFLLGAFSTTLYDFEIVEEGILKVDVPAEEVSDFYEFLSNTFNAFEKYVQPSDAHI